MISETTASTQEPMSLATAHEWKYLAQKAAKQRAGALARLKDMTEQRDTWRERAEAAEVALAEHDEPCECWMAHHGEPMHGNRHCSNCGHPIKTPVAQKCTWTPLHFGGIIVGCTSAPWDGDVPEVCPNCLEPVGIGELSY